MSATKVNICLIHQSSECLRGLALALRCNGMRCVEMGDVDEAQRHILPGACNVVVLDVSVEEDRGMDLLIASVRDRFMDTPLIAMTREGDAITTRCALRSGAWDCLEIPQDSRLLADRLIDAIDLIHHAVIVQEFEQPHAVGTPHSSLSEHRRFLDGLAQLRSLCQRQGKPLSLLTIDINGFSECNERFSTSFGDYVLGYFGGLLRRISRGTDLVARYDCDLFTVAMPGAQAEHAVELADRCREEIRRQPPLQSLEAYEVAFSAGVVESSVGFMETEQQIIRRSMIALNQAKVAGDQQTVTWSNLVENEVSRQPVEQRDLDTITTWVDRVREELRCAYVQSTRALVAAVETKDPLAFEHSLNVSNYAEAIAKKMELPGRQIEIIKNAAFLHDVGKIGVPDQILTKPDMLNIDEYEVVKRHPHVAMDILGHVQFLSEELPLILCHHERHDGMGYPSGMRGSEIPVGARIIAVADAIEVMLSSRSYKQPFDHSRVRSELTVGSGRQFDPEVVEVALEWLEETPSEQLKPSHHKCNRCPSKELVSATSGFRSSAGEYPIWR